jgi:RNA polymerase sigma-54 factor
MEMTHELVLGQQLKISPRLIQANHILGLSSLELQRFIQQETYENPALEVTEEATCPVCGTVLLDTTCHNCATPRPVATPVPSDSSEAYFEEPTWERGAAGGRDDEFDLLSLVAAQMTLSERLLLDLRGLVTEPGHQAIGEFLVGNLDENGWLYCSVGEAAAVLGVDEADVEHVLLLLQSLEPIGIGARDVQECLMIQLAYLESQGISRPHVHVIIQDYFDELAHHKYQRIAQALKVPVEEIIEECQFVRHQLNPFPAQQDGYRPRTAPAEVPRYILPDVIISLGDDEQLSATVVESKRYMLRINPQYQQIWRQIEAHPSGVPEGDREHVRQYVTRAKRFMANLEQRRLTMQKIGDFLVEYQGEFMLHGVRHLKPLTRAMVAATTGMHESTVSRATASKYVMLPNGHVIPFSDFFTAALNVKDVIKDLIEHETSPMPDQDIMEKLQEYGHYIARRTVAKYRDELKILPSSLRS